MLVTVRTYTKNDLSRILVSIKLFLEEENWIRLRTSYLIVTTFFKIKTLAKGEAEKALTNDTFETERTRYKQSNRKVRHTSSKHNNYTPQQRFYV